MALTPKENLFLKDMKKQSELCMGKYETYATSAKDPTLASLFGKLHNAESQNHSLIMAVDKGQSPKIQAKKERKDTFSGQYPKGQSKNKKQDAFLCNDSLSNEKYLAGLYNTCIFEFNAENHRAVLNHIQTECQQHGKMLYDYMTANNMMS